MPEPLERQQRELLELVGTSDPASPAFRARVDELLREPCAVPSDPARLRRALALNALLRDAVRREQEELAGLMQQARQASLALAQAERPGATGDSCDVRG